MELVTHSELIGTINGSTDFQVNTFTVQPGLAEVFPWLSKQAVLFQQWRVRSMTFQLLTRTGTTTTGSVIMAADYDASQPPPTTEEQVTAYQGAIEDSPWKGMEMKIDPSAVHSTGPRKFVRDAIVPGDINNYDGCNVFVCTLGMADVSAVSKLWVHYTIELHVPQIAPTSVTSNCLWSAVRNRSDTRVSLLPAGVPTPLTGLLPVANSYGITIDGKGDIRAPKGPFLVSAIVEVTLDSGAGWSGGGVNLVASGPGLLPGGDRVVDFTTTAKLTVQMAVQFYWASDGENPLLFTLTAQENTAGSFATCSYNVASVNITCV